MNRDRGAAEPRPSLAMNVELSRGRHGASARVELIERGPGPLSRLALVALRGWIDGAAERRLEQVFDDLAARGVGQVVLDCAALRHIDYRQAPALVDAVGRFESRSGGILVCGLSRHLRDLFRLTGCEPRLSIWPSAAELLERPAEALEATGEHAS